MKQLVFNGMSASIEFQIPDAKTSPGALEICGGEGMVKIIASCMYEGTKIHHVANICMAHPCEDSFS